MENLTNHCTGCGTCCKTIPLQFGMEYHQKFAKWNKFSKWVTDNLIPIDLQTAINLNPDLTKVTTEKNFYSCKNLGKNNKCQIYETRPEMCRVYPYNGQMFYELENLINTSKCNFAKNYSLKNDFARIKSELTLAEIY